MRNLRARPAFCEAPPGFPTAATSGFLRRRDRWMAGLVARSAPSLHRVARVLRRRRCLPRPVCEHDPLVATLLAFFFAVGIAAHALDELNGRPLRTRLGSEYLVAATVIGLATAVALGVIGVTRTGWVLLPFIVIGPLIVIAYNAELFGGLLHNDVGFALGWGAFPVLTAYVAQTKTLAWAPVLAALGAFALSVAQRRLSTPARALRRRTEHGRGSRYGLGRRGASDRRALPACSSRGRVAGSCLGDDPVRDCLAVARLT